MPPPMTPRMGLPAQRVPTATTATATPKTMSRLAGSFFPKSTVQVRGSLTANP